MQKRQYIFRDVEFVLEPLSESVVKVTYEDQTGYVGLKRDWEADRPFTWINWEGDVNEEGIWTDFSYSYPVPEFALEDLCRVLLREQRKQDSQRIHPGERKKAARQIFREFLEEMPEAIIESLPTGPTKDQETGSTPSTVPQDLPPDSLRQLVVRSQRMKERAEALLDQERTRQEKDKFLRQ